MRKNQNLILSSLLVLFALALNFNQPVAEAQQIFGKVVGTVCVVKATGEIVGYSNNCAAGQGTCVDNTCQPAGPPSIQF